MWYILKRDSKHIVFLRENQTPWAKNLIYTRKYLKICMGICWYVSAWTQSQMNINHM